MVVGISIFELHLPEARGLKEKRKVVKSLIDRIHHRFRVSIAETGLHDLHQRAEIAIAAVALSEQQGHRLMESIRSLIDAQPEAVLTHWDPQLMEGLE
ncbi:MAG: DUF503 domain-containing protein [bacterium]|nr:DUF503 domain-containing protein [bacterium]